jgi:hypothetical protein
MVIMEAVSRRVTLRDVQRHSAYSESSLYERDGSRSGICMYVYMMKGF